MAANLYLRWNLLFLAALLEILLVPLWLPFVPILKYFSSIVIISVLAVFQFYWLLVTILAGRRIQAIRRARNVTTVKNKDVEKGQERSNIRHLVAITMYKEPLEVLDSTLESLKNQGNATTKLAVVIGLEEGTPERDLKTAMILKKYSANFQKLMVTHHPRGLPGEIAGKCSNINFASRHAVNVLKNDPSYDFNNVDLIFTNCDCDAIFAPNYMKTLEDEYLKLQEEERHLCIWQSLIIYKTSSKVPFYVRITGLLRTFCYAGVLIPWNLNPMSMYSLSAKLLEEGNYSHPGYQMEDIIALNRYTIQTRKALRIRPLNIISVNGPTSGANAKEELYEWARQIRRWTVGAGEVFHYFMIKLNHMPSVCLSLDWAIRFFSYYGVMLCAAPIFSITAPISIMLFGPEHFVIIDRVFFQTISLSVLGLQYLWFGLVIIFVEYGIHDQDDRSNIFANLLHWLAMFPVVVAYSCIELFAFVELAIRGKTVCRHGAAKKNNLKF